MEKNVYNLFNKNLRACSGQDLEHGKRPPAICNPVVFSQPINANSEEQSVIMIMGIFDLIFLYQNLIHSFILSCDNIAHNSIFHKLFDIIFMKALSKKILERYFHHHFKDCVMTN